MNNFSKFYLLSPESYNKLVLDKMEHQGIDREMYNVLNIKKISDAKKWYLYRDLLLRFANKARNHRTINKNPLNVIDPSITQSLFKKHGGKKTPLKYSAQTQTNIVRRPRINKINQTENEQNEIGIQTNLGSDETMYEINPEDSHFYDASENEENIEWPYKEGMPGFSASPKPATSTSRKSVNSPMASPTSSVVAKTLLNKSKSKPLVRRALTFSGEKDKQLKLNFPILKIPTYKTRSVAAGKTQNVQIGKNCFKWTCMK